MVLAMTLANLTAVLKKALEMINTGVAKQLLLITKVRVIKAGPRPVELRAAYLSPDLQLFPLLGADGKFNRDLEQFTRQREQGHFRRKRN